MTLRTRLTLFYTLLVAIVLFLFGLAAYASTESILNEQIDLKLNSAVLDTEQVFKITESRDFVLTYGKNVLLTEYGDFVLTYGKSILVQYWDMNGELVYVAEDNIIKVTETPMHKPALKKALDGGQRIWGEVYRGDLHYKVLTETLLIDGVPAGVLQVGTSMGDADRILINLKRVLISIGLVAVMVAGFFVGGVTQRALIPLATVTRTASEIQRADDLSRRIPEADHQHDEVGQLIKVFNLTLERLEKLFRSQQRFIADVGHELRTPLTAIKGNADLMRRVGKMDDESLQAMENEIDRLTRMVGDLLLVAQAESGSLPLDFRQVEVDTILLEVFQQMKVLARGIKEFKIAEIDQVLVCGDRDRLKQVMLNLVSNALNYTPKDGYINLKLGKKGGHAYFMVTDTGPGIAQENLEHIFERFYRAEKSRSRRDEVDGKGFGLGLSIAYWIVQNHGGRIDVKSELGEGTTFTVWLPLANGNCSENIKALTPAAGEPARTS